MFHAPLPLPGDDAPEFFQGLAAFQIASRIPPGARVTLGVPRGEFMLRRFETPPVKARNLPALVGFEIDRHLPGRRDEFLWGWRIDGRTADGGYQIVFGAGRKAAVDPLAALLRRANLAPTSIRPETFALADLLRRTAGLRGDALLVDLGRTVAGIDFISGGRPRLSWIEPVDDPQWREASTVHPAGGAPGGGAVAHRQEAAARFGGVLAERIATPLFRESLPGGVVPGVHLCGYGANRSRLIEVLQTQLKVPVRAFSPWPLVRWANPPADLTSYTAALALAFMGDRPPKAGIELHPERQDELHRAPSLRLSAALALSLAAVLVGHLAVHGVRQQRQLALADQEIRSLKAKMAKVEEINKAVRVRRERLDYLEATVGGRARPSELLRELTRLLPDSAYLSELTFKGRTVEVTGLAPAAEQLLPLIEASLLFSGVEFSAPIVSQGQGLQRFRIRMQLEGTGG